MSWQCAPALCSGDFTYTDTDTDPFAGCLQLQHHGRACAPVRICSIKPRWSRAGFQPIGPASHGVRACHDRLVCLGLPTCAASVEGHPADHPAEHSSGSSTHAASRSRPLLPATHALPWASSRSASAASDPSQHQFTPAVWSSSTPLGPALSWAPSMGLAKPSLPLSRPLVPLLVASCGAHPSICHFLVTSSWSSQSQDASCCW